MASVNSRYLDWKGAQPCPNPECVEVSLVMDITLGGWCVACVGCGMSGPLADSDSEALRLWSLLPRIRMVSVSLLPGREKEMKEGYEVGIRHALAIARDVYEEGYPVRRDVARRICQEINRRLLGKED